MAWLANAAPPLVVVVQNQGLGQNHNHSLGGELNSRNCTMLLSGKRSEKKLRKKIFENISMLPKDMTFSFAWCCETGQLHQG